MTNLFISVFNTLAYQNGWYHKHHNGVISSFMDDIRKRKGFRFVSVNNVPVDFDSIKIPYLGSHLVRDPRDLLLSGYRYHLWCKEPWVHDPMTEEFKKRIRITDIDPSLGNESLTYQQVLNRVDRETGLLIEYYWRHLHFQQMDAWDYQNPHILELKYETIFGHESETFEQILRFYKLPEPVVQSGIQLAHHYSFSEQKDRGKTGEGKHATKGSIRQWESDLPGSLVKLVSNDFSGLLLKLGYTTI